MTQPTLAITNFQNRLIAMGSPTAYNDYYKPHSELYQDSHACTHVRIFNLKNIYGFIPRLIIYIHIIQVANMYTKHNQPFKYARYDKGQYQKRKVVSPKYYDLFAYFTEEFENSNYNTRFPEANGTTNRPASLQAPLIS